MYFQRHGKGRVVEIISTLRIGIVEIEYTLFGHRQKGNVLEWVMLLLPAKVDTLCQEEIRKLQVWSSIKNYNERKTRKENRKSRFRFLQNIRKVNSFFRV